MFEKPPEIKKSSEKKERDLVNVKEIETPNARYRICYDSHESVVDPQLLDGCDGLVLEMAANYGDPQKAGKVFGKLGKSEQFSKIFLAAAKSNKPIYFVDICEDGKSLAEEVDRLQGKILAESVAAGGLMLYALSDLEKNKKMNRRGFLKLGLKAVAAAYLSTPIAQELAFVASLDKNKSVPDEQSVSRKAEKILGRINEAIHPELATIAVEVRNDLMAQKTETAARLFQREKGKKPRLAMIVGAQHFGMEKTLANSEPDRVSRLKKALGGELSKNSAIAKIEFISGEGVIYYDAKIIKDAALE